MILQPPATLIMGPPGSGKTDVLATYIEAGIELFVISTEPDGISSLVDSVKRRELDMEKLHWCSVLPATGEWSAITDMVNTIAGNSYEAISSIKSGVGKDKTRGPALKLLHALQDFPCERTGKMFGDTSTWDDTRALCLDSSSGLSLISMALTIGFKPAAHQGEWGVAMNFVEQLLMKMTSDRSCFFTFTAHVEKELNELTGVSQIMVSTLGRKLAPKIPRFFSEVILAKKIVNMQAGTAAFSWANADNMSDLKSRALPISTSMEPSFVPVVEAYRLRTKAAGAVPQAPSATPVVAFQPFRPPVMPVAPLTSVAKPV